MGPAQGIRGDSLAPVKREACRKKSEFAALRESMKSKRPARSISIKEKPTLKKNNRLMQIIAAVATCLVVASSGYAQQLIKGKIEATGQVGVATGIGTQASFAGTLGTAIRDNVFVLGEFGWIPLGGANASGSTPSGSFQFSSGGRVLSFMVVFLTGTQFPNRRPPQGGRGRR